MSATQMRSLSPTRVVLIVPMRNTKVILTTWALYIMHQLTARHNIRSCDTTPLTHPLVHPSVNVWS